MFLLRSGSWRAALEMMNRGRVMVHELVPGNCSTVSRRLTVDPLRDRLIAQPTNWQQQWRLLLASKGKWAQRAAPMATAT
jgi:hypothetical protein